jgi:hypothetical protein
MSWTINDRYYLNQLVIRTETPNSYQLVYAKKMTLDTLTSNFEVTRADLSHDGHSHQSNELIFLCVAANVGGDTDTVSYIPVNSENINSPMDEFLWVVLIDDQGTELHVKRTTRQVSDAQPFIGDRKKS